MRVTSLQVMPYVSLSDNGAGELQINSGIFGDVFNRLSQVLNFSYTVINPSDGEWGSVKIDGTWSGMVGQLATKTVDFGTQTKLQISCLVDCKTIRTLGYMIHPILLTRNSDTSNFRLYGPFLAGPKRNGLSYNKIFRI